MAGIALGNLTVADANAVYMLFIHHHEGLSGIFLTKSDPHWELCALMTDGCEILCDIEKSESVIEARLVDYATKLGLCIIGPKRAIQRSSIVATYVERHPGDSSKWRVVLKTNVADKKMYYATCNSLEESRTSMYAVNKKLFANTPADVPATETAAVTPQ